MAAQGAPKEPNGISQKHRPKALRREPNNTKRGRRDETYTQKLLISPSSSRYVFNVMNIACCLLAFAYARAMSTAHAMDIGKCK